MATVSHSTVPIKDLTVADHDHMYALMDKYYIGVDRQTFERDLSEKEHVMLLTSAGQIVGFSTLMRFDLNVGGNTTKAVFSGDTVVEEVYRQNLGFAYEVTRYFHQTLEQFQPVPVYYVLICKGWRTYRILPFLFREFSPAPRRPTLPVHVKVMDQFGAKKYPNNYNASTGLIEFSEETQRIRPGSAEDVSALRNDRYMQFFAKANPTYLNGTELVCIAEIAESNYSNAFKQLLAGRGEVQCSIAC